MPGSDIAVDEMIVRYEGRSHQVTTVPNKPTPTGVKIWGLAQKNFLLSWNYHTPGESNGPVDTLTPVELGGIKNGKKGNKTQAVVAKLIGQLPNKGRGYHLWCDNLFVSTRFLEYMRSQIGCGVTGPARTNAGFLQEILDFKASDKNDKVPWGTKKHLHTADNQASCMYTRSASLI